MSTDRSTYFVWRQMLARCENPDHKSYETYGAIGIYVCERWHTYANFAADMGEKPEGMTLERMDGTKGYELGNCKWATRVEQNRNRRSNINLTHDGKTQCVAAWAEELGLSEFTIHRRLTYGFPVELALSQESFRGKSLDQVKREYGLCE